VTAVKRKLKYSPKTKNIFPNSSSTLALGVRVCARAIRKDGDLNITVVAALRLSAAPCRLRISQNHRPRPDNPEPNQSKERSVVKCAKLTRPYPIISRSPRGRCAGDVSDLPTQHRRHHCVLSL
jgi:hypothetical protein